MLYGTFISKGSLRPGPGRRPGHLATLNYTICLSKGVYVESSEVRGGLFRPKSQEARLLLIAGWYAYKFG